MNKFKNKSKSILKAILENVPNLSIFLRKIRDNNKNALACLTPHGFLLQGNSLMQGDMFEPVETKAIKQLLIGVDSLINIGANIGYYACIALHQGKSVIAFEPMPGNLHHLLANMKLNGWHDRVEIFPIALSDTSGVAQIYGGGTGASLIKGWANVPSKYATSIPLNTANQVLGERLNGTYCLILVDIEGAEYKFLKGATNLLHLTPAPIWLIEITIGEHLPKGTHVNPNLLATFDIFFDAGYFAWAVSGETRFVERKEIELISTTNKDTLFTHNFIFAKDIDRIEELLRGA